MKLETNKSWLKKRYVDDRRTIEEIASEAHCSVSTIRRRLREFGLMK